MAKVNHRDTLDTELRELQRRLRLLEARRAAPPAFVPARSTDWWQLSAAADWTDLASATATSASTLHLRAAGTGDVRVQVDGQPDTQYTAGDHLIPLAGAGNVRIQGRGTVQVFATLE